MLNFSFARNAVLLAIMPLFGICCIILQMPIYFANTAQNDEKAGFCLPCRLGWCLIFAQRGMPMRTVTANKYFLSRMRVLTAWPRRQRMSRHRRLPSAGRRGLSTQLIFCCLPNALAKVCHLSVASPPRKRDDIELREMRKRAALADLMTYRDDYFSLINISALYIFIIRNIYEKFMKTPVQI